MLLIQSTILLANLEFHTHIKQADVYNLLFVIPLNCTKRTEPTLVFFHPAVRAAPSSQVPSETRPAQADTQSQPSSLNALLSGHSWFLFSFSKFFYILLLLLDHRWIRSGSAFASQLKVGHFCPGFGYHLKPKVRISYGKRGKAKLILPGWFCF